MSGDFRGGTLARAIAIAALAVVVTQALDAQPPQQSQPPPSQQPAAGVAPSPAPGTPRQAPNTAPQPASAQVPPPPPAPDKSPVPMVEMSFLTPNTRESQIGWLMLTLSAPCVQPACLVQIGTGLTQPFEAESLLHRIYLSAGKYSLVVTVNGSVLKREQITIEGKKTLFKDITLPSVATPPPPARRDGTIVVWVGAPSKVTVGTNTQDVAANSEHPFQAPLGDHIVRVEAAGNNYQLPVALTAEIPAVRIVLPAPKMTPAPSLGGDPKFVDVAGGSAVEVGCVDNDPLCRPDEKKRIVNVPRFQMMTTEVTVGRFEEWLKGQRPSDYDRPEWTVKIPVADLSMHPVVNVTWDEASAYCKDQGARLPTEAEFEAAARGGRRGRIWAWDEAADSMVPGLPGASSAGGRAQSGVGEAAGGRQPGNFADEAARQKNPTWKVMPGYDDKQPYTAPVGMFRPFNGLYDLAGNVWEWTSDDYDARRKVARGGSWTSTPPVTLRISHRLPADPNKREDDIGFRCVRDVTPTSR